MYSFSLFSLIVRNGVQPHVLFFDKNKSSLILLSINRDAVASSFSVKEAKTRYLRFNFHDAWCVIWTFSALLLASLLQGRPLAAQHSRGSLE